MLRQAQQPRPYQNKKTMSQQKETRRRLIVQKLRNAKRATRKEIMDYLEFEFTEILGENFNMSNRTFERDLKAIERNSHIYIKCDKSTNRYFIEDEDEGVMEYNERFFGAMDIYNALKIDEQNRDYIFFDKRQAKGTEHLFGLLHAIKNRLQISIGYHRDFSEKVLPRKLEPLALKEFKYRWYLFARDVDDKRTKVYGLDRITDLEITKKKFPKNTEFDLAQTLKHRFGINFPKENEKPQRVVLSFTAQQGKYIKSVPLHKTQAVLIDNNKELRVCLNIFPTYDFRMELLSYGETVKVIEPKRLTKEMKNVYQTALGQYD